MKKKERYDLILEHFREKMPLVTTELDFGSTFQLLVAVVLSARVRKSFSRYYMDSYSYIWDLTGGVIDPYTTDTGSCTVKGHDGLHYNRKTNRLLHRWIRQNSGIE